VDGCEELATRRAALQAELAAVDQMLTACRAKASPGDDGLGTGRRRQATVPMAEVDSVQIGSYTFNCPLSVCGQGTCQKMISLGNSAPFLSAQAGSAVIGRPIGSCVQLCAQLPPTAPFRRTLAGSAARLWSLHCAPRSHRVEPIELHRHSCFFSSSVGGRAAPACSSIYTPTSLQGSLPESISRFTKLTSL
jgi:hypothetical protein